MEKVLIISSNNKNNTVYITNNSASRFCNSIKMHKNVPLIRKKPPFICETEDWYNRTIDKSQTMDYEEGQVAENERYNCFHGEYL